MKHALEFFLFVILAAATPSYALDKLVTVEGPVEVIARSADGSTTTYYVQSPEKSRYKIMIPDSDTQRFALLMKEAPSATVRFDGTVINNDDTVPVLNVKRWERVTTTTTTHVDEHGNVQKRTTVVRHR